MIRLLTNFKKTNSYQSSFDLKAIRQVMIIGFGLSFIFLQGCSVMSSKLECNEIGGIKGCVSMAKVNRMSNAGAISEHGIDKGLVKKMMHKKGVDSASSANASYANNYAQNSNFKGLNVAAPDIGQPVRKGEDIQQIIVFPYEDRAGNYHEPSVIYTVLRKPHWIGYPTNKIQDVVNDI